MKHQVFGADYFRKTDQIWQYYEIDLNWSKDYLSTSKQLKLNFGKHQAQLAYYDHMLNLSEQYSMKHSGPSADSIHTTVKLKHDCAIHQGQSAG